MDMVYGLLIIALTCNAIANILIKLGAESFAEGMKVLFQHPWQMFSNGYFFSGILFFALALVLYAQVLAKMNLSVAYPIMTSVGFVIVVGFSVFALQEQLFWWQWVGIVLILTGVFLLSQGATG